MKNLYIIRGLPGSGKSTIAKSLGKSWQIFEADQFFMKNGKYEFDGSKLKDAHDWCKRKVHNAIHPGLVKVIEWMLVWMVILNLDHTTYTEKLCLC